MGRLVRRAVGASLLVLLSAGCGISVYVVRGAVLRPAEAGEPQGPWPVAGAEVVLTHDPEYQRRPVKARTDADGRFKLTFLGAPPWGDLGFELHAQAPGYAGRSVSIRKPAEKGDWPYCEVKEQNICWEGTVVLERGR
jgi:hypothetical protein